MRSLWVCSFVVFCSTNIASAQKAINKAVTASIDVYVDSIDHDTNIVKQRLNNHSDRMKSRGITRDIFTDKNSTKVVQTVTLFNDGIVVDYFKNQQRVYSRYTTSQNKAVYPRLFLTLKAVSLKDSSFVNWGFTYYQNNQVIYTDKYPLLKEKIIEITYSSVGGGCACFSDVKVSKDTIWYKSNTLKKQTIANKSINWDKLIKSINIEDFDSIFSGEARAPIDGVDEYYTIKTNKGEHSARVGYYDQIYFRFSKDFFRIIDDIIHQFKKQ